MIYIVIPYEGSLIDPLYWPKYGSSHRSFVLACEHLNDLIGAVVTPRKTGNRDWHVACLSDKEVRVSEHVVAHGFGIFAYSVPQ